ncbi:MAG TPA: ABC transporter substrate-binding protein [Anaerolineaceae bacterium]|nr:ABC transporter substrate-binding protein [Anaerolineaceae bacterium]
MMKRLNPIFMLTVLLLTACTGAKPAQNGPLRAVTLNLTYIPNVQFAPFYAAIENGYFADAGLDVTLNYGNEADLIALVGSGKQQFMIASGEQVLMARAQGLPVVTVYNWYKEFPVGIVSLAEKNITSPMDLKGKTIGLPGLYGANYIGFEAFAQNEGLRDSDYTLQSIGYTQVESLVSGIVDAAVIYLSNEPSQLRAMGYQINTLRVADSIDLIGNGLVTNESTIKEDPELVRAVLGALLKGIQFSAENPDETYLICAKYVDNLAEADEAVQKQVLAESIKLWDVYPTNEDHTRRWENMQSVLLKLGLMSQAVDLKGVYDGSFLP